MSRIIDEKQALGPLEMFKAVAGYYIQETQTKHNSNTNLLSQGHLEMSYNPDWKDVGKTVSRDI